MTSASELFHNRRSRIGRNDPESGFGSSSSSSLDRTVPSPIPSHHNHNHNHDRRRSRHHHHRREVEEIDQIRRSSSNSRHFCHREHETIRFEHGANQVSTRNSSSGSGTSSSRANRMQLSRSDQLPGDVLLARERLVERLRGVSISSNRSAWQSNRWDEFTYNDDAGDWETEPPPPPSTSDWFNPQRPRGLSQEEVNHLHREIYNDDDNKLLLKECSICLEYFHDGDEVMFLPCDHKFHSTCLYPWVQTCGDCPNCRAGVLDSMSPQD